MTVSPKYMCLKRLDYVFNFLNHSRSKSNHNWVEGGGGNHSRRIIIIKILKRAPNITRKMAMALIWIR